MRTGYTLVLHPALHNMSPRQGGQKRKGIQKGAVRWGLLEIRPPPQQNGQDMFSVMKRIKRIEWRSRP